MELETENREIRTVSEPDSSAREAQLLDLLIILSKRRKFILRFTLGITLATLITVFLVPSRYTAETVVLPPAQNSSLSSTLLSQMGEALSLPWPAAA